MDESMKQTWKELSRLGAALVTVDEKKLTNTQVAHQQARWKDTACESHCPEPYVTTLPFDGAPRVSTSAKNGAMMGEPWPTSGKGVYVVNEAGAIAPLLLM